MRYRKLDRNGDYMLGTGPAEFLVNKAEAVGQAVLTRLSLWSGTWFTDTSDGTPWRTDMLGKYPASIYDPILRRRILETEGVLSIQEYVSQVDANTRTLRLQVTIDTIYGTSTINGNLA